MLNIKVNGDIMKSASKHNKNMPNKMVVFYLGICKIKKDTDKISQT